MFPLVAEGFGKKGLGAWGGPRKKKTKGGAGPGRRGGEKGNREPGPKGLGGGWESGEKKGKNRPQEQQKKALFGYGFHLRLKGGERSVGGGGEAGRFNTTAGAGNKKRLPLRRQNLNCKKKEKKRWTWVREHF